MLTNPTIETLKALKLHGMTGSARGAAADPRRAGALLRGTLRAARRSRAALPREPATHSAVARGAPESRRGQHRGHQLQGRPRPRQTPDRAARHRRVDPPRPEPAHHRRNGLRQDLDRLRARAADLPPGRLGAVLARAATDRGAAHRARRRQLHEVPQDDRQGRPHRPGRLGTDRARHPRSGGSAWRSSTTASTPARP